MKKLVLTLSLSIFCFSMSFGWVTAGRNITKVDSTLCYVNVSYLKQLNGISHGNGRAKVDLFLEWMKGGGGSACDTIDFTVLYGSKFDTTARMCIPVILNNNTGTSNAIDLPVLTSYRLIMDTLRQLVDSSWHLQTYGIRHDTTHLLIPLDVPANVERIYIKTKWRNYNAVDTLNVLRINAW